MSAAPRPRKQRIEDTLRRFDTDVDTWVATADPGTGMPYLIPLSHLWDGTHLVLSTSDRTPTARNLRATGHTRLGFGPTRDLAVVEGTVAKIVAAADIDSELGDTFAVKTGFDPRKQGEEDYFYFFVRPQRVQAWREYNEHVGREIMRDGQWL